ncbi:hypothetical protein CANARDRAFT_229632 [[Candida] arabinofermentans NRRL YB-2248]|uniref:Serine hydrolase domain-containing protein n=1 Tax=[Candida] arabinofermentans NRRL YB-2248 TaxID=983967 RepID=A0A1E4T684_9ASCO|nr:hypothetical protein CANARDRAFT_229632 [[Candida] arabinofermentans NRRL YB-2248]
MSAKAIKGTILCLHGFAQNGPTFSAKASGIRKALKKVGYHTIFINGPIELAAADLPFAASSLGADDKSEESNYRGWFYTTEDYEVQPAFDAIKDSYKEHGPFVGLIGFSQGAGLAALIMNDFAKIVGSESADEELKFGIIYSGFKVKPEKYQHYYQPSIKKPMLHIYGELDTLVSSDRSQALVDLCDFATVLKHPGGHYVPNQKDLLKREVAWVENVMNGGTGQLEEPKEKTEEDEKKELEKLNEEMDKLSTK